MTFKAQVQKFKLKADGSVDKTVRAITFALFRGVIEMSPVLTGQFRGNWQASIGSPVDSAIDRPDKTGSKAIADVVANIGGAGSVSYLANNMPYGERLEYEGPGMVRVTFARVSSIVKKAVAEGRLT